ncbi:MAG: SGNH/GDSL hydrolase family protein [bacterium]|nr:SGNH/GDSL hydrolase family protein [bacterium]
MPHLRYLRKPSIGVALFVMQVLRAAYRKDLPSLENQDPSGVFGDPASPPLRLVVLGDSSVTSPGVEPLDASWPRQIAHRLAEQFHVELHSVAVGGSKACDVLTSQLADAIAFQPDIAIISVGANDAMRGVPLARFDREYDKILAQMARHVPGIAVSGVGDLGSIPRLPALARSLIRIRGRSFDRAIRRVTARYPGVLKTHTWSSGWNEFRTNPEEAFAGDLFHASAYGHRIYTNAAMPAVNALVERLTEEEATGS